MMSEPIFIKIRVHRGWAVAAIVARLTAEYLTKFSLACMKRAATLA